MLGLQAMIESGGGSGGGSRSVIKEPLSSKKESCNQSISNGDPSILTPLYVEDSPKKKSSDFNIKGIADTTKLQMSPSYDDITNKIIVRNFI